MSINEKADIYTRITNHIIADLEQGVRPWFKPWNAEHAAGRITRPLRHNGTSYRGINTIMLWSDAVAKGFTCPIWMAYKQAQEIDGLPAQYRAVAAPMLDPVARIKGAGQAFAKLKAHLRRIAARTIDDLWKDIGSICDIYDPDECWNYLKAACFTVMADKPGTAQEFA